MEEEPYVPLDSHINASEGYKTSILESLKISQCDVKA